MVLWDTAIILHGNYRCFPWLQQLLIHLIYAPIRMIKGGRYERKGWKWRLMYFKKKMSPLIWIQPVMMISWDNIQGVLNTHISVWFVALNRIAIRGLAFSFFTLTWRIGLSQTHQGKTFRAKQGPRGIVLRAIIATACVTLPDWRDQGFVRRSPGIRKAVAVNH